MKYKTRHFNSVTSTQDKAKEFAKKGLSDIAVISDVQTKARGRLKRKWHASKGGIWLSILLKPDNIKNLQYLTFGAAVSVVQSIKKYAGISTKIKWPNDVHYKGKKLCGILTEGIFGKENHVIVGIGLNVNQTSFPSEIRDTATSLKAIKHQKIGIKKLSNSIIREFFGIYGNYYNKHRLKTIMDLWKMHCDTLNKDVIVATNAKKIHGKAAGIDKDCNLLLKLKNNRTIKLSEGDITIRY